MDSLEELKRLEALADGIDISDSDDSDMEEESQTDQQDGSNNSELSEASTRASITAMVQEDIPPKPNISKVETQSQTPGGSHTHQADLSAGNFKQEASSVRQHQQTLSQLFLSVDKAMLLSRESSSECEEDDDDEEEGDATTIVAIRESGIPDRQKSTKMSRLEEENEADNTPMDECPDVSNEMSEDEEKDEEDEEKEEEEKEEDYEDEDEGESSGLPPTDENLAIINTNYKDYLENFLSTLTKELDDNLQRQYEIELELEEKESKLSNATKHPIKRHVSISKKSMIVFGYPYFKDKQLYHPPSNADTLLKRQRNELDVWIEFPRPWTEQERRRLTDAVRWEARTRHLESCEYRLKELARKQPSQVEEEKALKLEINQTHKLPDRALLKKRYDDYDWMSISATHLGSAHSPKACELQWKNLIHPSLNRAAWSKEEDKQLKMFADATKCSEWDSIAREMNTGRTAIACFTRYLEKFNPVTNNRSWTSREDAKLLRLVAHCKLQNLIPWPKVSYYMPRRSKEQCCQRYQYSLKHTIRHGKFTDPELWILILGERLYGRNWTSLAELIPTRTVMQIQAHWSNYMAADFGNAWTTEENILLLETVKRVGLRNWAEVAKTMDDGTGRRNRVRCRDRFFGIYNLFSKSPNTAVEDLAHLDTNRTAANRRTQAFESLKQKFAEWTDNMDEEMVSSNIPIPQVNLNEETLMPNGSHVKNRIISKFIRHAQTLLPIQKPPPLAPLPPPRLRTLPSQVDAPLSLRPLGRRWQKTHSNIKTDRGSRRQKGSSSSLSASDKSSSNKKKKTKSKRAGTKQTAKKSVTDRELDRIFRASYMIKPGRFFAQHTPEQLGFLNIVARHLDEILDFSSLRANLNSLSSKFDKLNSWERQALESFRFQSDITEEEATAPRAREDYGGGGECNVAGRAIADLPMPGPSTNHSVITKTYEKRGLARPVSQPTLPGMSLLMPNHNSLLMLRGSLLHHNYTMGLSRQAESGSLVACKPVRPCHNLGRSVQHGIYHVVIRKPAPVGDSLFTDISSATDDDLTDRRAQVSADLLLAERMIKLLFWPAKMSVVPPSNQEDLFDLKEEDHRGSAQDSSATSVLNTVDLETPATLPDVTSAATGGTVSPSFTPPVFSLSPSIRALPSVTRTYSRKRPATAPKLAINFKDLISQDQPSPAKRPCAGPAPTNCQK